MSLTGRTPRSAASARIASSAARTLLAGQGEPEGPQGGS
jgi:hypothetical protein